MRPALLTCSAALWAATSAPGAALAQTAPCGEVDAAIQRANAMRQAGHDRDAADLLRPFLACGANPRLQATVGLAELAAALWVQGFQHLSGALAATADPWIAPRRATLRAALDQARGHVGYLEVTANAPGAELRIGGERVTTLPMSGPIRVPTGTLTYELGASGFVTELRRVEIAGNDALTREHVMLTPRRAEAERPPTPVVSAPTPVVSAATPVVSAAAVAPDRAPATTDAPGGWMRTGGWVGLAGSAALLGGGVAFYMVSAGAVDRWNDDGQCFYGGLTRSERCGDARQTAMTFYPLALTGFVAGGILMAGSAALLIAAPSRGAGRERAWAPRCGVGPGTVGVSCAASF